MAMITSEKTITDTWIRVDDDETVPNTGDVIVSLDRFLEQLDELSHRSGRLGVAVASDDDVYTLQPGLDELDLVAIDFPRFADGRGYSHARILRDNLGFAGTLRATGEILHDQLFYYHRCGFDEFSLPTGSNVDYNLKSGFDVFSLAYQPASDGREASLTPGNEVA